MTTQDWLKGSVGFTLTELNIQFIFENRGVTYDADASTMSEKQKDLSRADAYTIYLTSSNKGGYKQQDGNSSLSENGESFTYRDEAQRLAIFYYEKWGEVPPNTTGNIIGNGTNRW